MKMKNTLCVLLAAATALGTVALTGCGDSASSSSASSKAVAQADNKTTDAAKESTDSKDINAIADQIKTDITFDDSLSPLPTDNIESIYGIAADKYSSAVIYVGTGATPEEIAFFEAADTASADAIKDALQKRIESQTKLFTDYAPDEMYKLESPCIIEEGNYVFLCISPDNSKATEIIG